MTSSQASNRVIMSYEDSERFARLLDKRDPLSSMREEFLFPTAKNGDPVIYMSGNSLGLQPKKVRDYIDQELTDWANFGVEGHFHAKYPWVPYHENLTESTARLVGALPHEVVVMNSLTVNLHLMMVSFYRPVPSRYRILIEGAAFPSDQYAVASQARLHGFEPGDAVIEIIPREGEETIRQEDILALLEAEGHSIALVLLGNCNYLTGQVFDMDRITRAAQAQGCVVGYNLAHGAGNLEMQLHDWNVDFAVWCSYKYLNAGPGGIAGCFVHERHASSFDLPRLAGWWGHDKQSRFLMGPSFNPIVGAEGWQLSNPPIFQLAALNASMSLFDKAGIANLRKKSEMLTGYMEFMLDRVSNGACRIITPKDPDQRGCQLSVHLEGKPKQVVASLKEAGAVCDFREPDVVRVAPAPLYNSFTDVWRFATMLADLIGSSGTGARTSSSVSSGTDGKAPLWKSSPAATPASDPETGAPDVIPSTPQPAADPADGLKPPSAVEPPPGSETRSSIKPQPVWITTKPAAIGTATAPQTEAAPEGTTDALLSSAPAEATAEPRLWKAVKDSQKQATAEDRQKRTGGTSEDSPPSGQAGPVVRAVQRSSARSSEQGSDENSGAPIDTTRSDNQ